MATLKLSKYNELHFIDFKTKKTRVQREICQKLSYLDLSDSERCQVLQLFKN